MHLERDYVLSTCVWWYFAVYLVGNYVVELKLVKYSNKDHSNTSRLIFIWIFSDVFEKCRNSENQNVFLWSLFEYFTTHITCTCTSSNVQIVLVCAPQVQDYYLYLKMNDISGAMKAHYRMLLVWQCHVEGSQSQGEDFQTPRLPSNDLDQPVDSGVLEINRLQCTLAGRWYARTPLLSTKN